MKRALFLAALGTTFCYAPVMAQSVTPRTVDFLYNQIVKAEASPNPALLNGLIAATLQSPDVIKEVRMQAQIGNAHAEDVLATCYVNGWGGLSQDNAQAMTWYKKAADQGDEDAKHNLHLLMTSGKLAAATPPPAPGFHPLTVDAIYKQIIATEASPHPNWVALRNQLQNADLMAQVQSQAKLGNAHAQDVLGNCYEGGWGGLSQDLAQAASWFRKAADQGDADAQYNLGVMYANGQGVPQDYAQAASWFRKAADQGYAAAQNNLGIMYANGQGVPQDYAQAASWFRKAADQGYADAQYNLGVMYHDGQGVPQDYAQAASWYRKAADQGYADAQYNLGVMYDNGQGVPQDYAQAASWYRKAADQGYAKAQYNLGVMYRDGQGVPQDYAQAASWFRKAADQGYAAAQNNLGIMYANGQGVPQDYAQAASWYRKAADQGYADAQYNLGVIYDNGQGVPQDYAQAASWYRKAADQGYAKAQNNLGVMYANGQGVPQDTVIAYALYNLSAANDPSQNNPASSNRADLSSSMTEQQIAEGQRLTRLMQSVGITKAIQTVTARSTASPRPTPRPTSQNGSPWPARPTTIPGETTCNTRCINGSCWRTYDNGRHVHFTVPPSVDPFSGELTYRQPPC